MITDTLDTLASFKTFQLSKFIEAWNTRIFSELNSPRFTPLILDYFKQVNKEGEPFTNFDRDPDNISQIKKLINALYHARLALIDLENIDIQDLGNVYSNATLLWQHTTEEVYKASYLFTHLDVDIKEMFGAEFNIILPLITQFKNKIQLNSAETQKIAATIKAYPLSHKIGEISGTAMQQMRPQSGDLDYSFLTQFSADLPKNINKLRQDITPYINMLPEDKVKLLVAQLKESEKLEELQQVALTLLNDLERLKGNSLFVSLKFLKYIHIIRNIITLSMSTIEQITNLNESSQDVIRNSLSQLKYILLPELFGLVDKIEDHAMLKPGTLSLPLMEQVKSFYALLIHYASKPVNFKLKGEELLSIEDSRFIALRLEGTHKRIDAAKKAIFKVNQVEEAFNSFYKIIEDSRYNQLTIGQLPRAEKYQLIEYYKQIKPYMMQVDIDLNDAIIAALLGSESWSSYLSKPLSKIYTPFRSQEHILSIVAQKTKLQNFIAKKKATQEFHIRLNRDLIKSIQGYDPEQEPDQTPVPVPVPVQADLVLFPYSSKTNLFVIDESVIINTKDDNFAELRFKSENTDKLITNPEKLSSDQAFDLYRWYWKKHIRLEDANIAFSKYIALLNEHNAIQKVNGKEVLDLDKLPKKAKLQCKQFYDQFQPYFINGAPAGFNAAVLEFDKYIVHCLNDSDTRHEPPKVDLFKQLDKHFVNYFTQHDLAWKKKSQKYLQQASNNYIDEFEGLLLKKDVIIGNRSHHVIQHTNYSKFVEEFRTALFEVTSLFNDAMQKSLTPQKTGVPFPNLEQSNLVLAEAKHVVALKQLFNSLYYIENILAKLEQLNNKSWETTYVKHLYKVYKHLVNLHKSMQSLAADPHLKLITGELFNKAQIILATIQEHTEAYQAGPETVSQEPVELNGLWYCLNAFYISPKHIRALRNTNYLTVEELNHLHSQAKRSALIIEKLIKSSNSYVKLFLQTPNMLHLYRELINKMNEFISTSHDAVMNNLDQFQSKIFAPMLLEADQWEDKLGLIPGTLSGPLNSIIDEYYKGLLEPLNLDSKTHITLVCDKGPLNQRILLTTEHIADTKKHLEKLEKNYQPTEHLYSLIQEYEKLAGGLVPAPGLPLNIVRDEIVAAYQIALPKLVKIQESMTLEPSKNLADTHFDKDLNSKNNEFDPALSNIRAIVAAGHHHYLGLKATEEMKLQTAEEKVTYLKKLSVTQDKDAEQFIKKYATEVFDKQLETFGNRHIGLQFTRNEYREKQKAYLLTFKEEIINQTRTSEDINLTVKNLLKDRIKIFENEHFAKYYHLEAIRTALAMFSSYLTASNAAIEHDGSLFENKTTIESKENLITTQVNSFEKKETIEARINEITSQVNTLTFERIILAHQEVDTFSFHFVVLVVLALLEALYLYTPTHKKLYNNLHKAVNNEPNISELTQRFGLFATAPVVNEEPESSDIEEETSNISTVPEFKLREEDGASRILGVSAAS